MYLKFFLSFLLTLNILNFFSFFPFPLILFWTFFSFNSKKFFESYSIKNLKFEPKTIKFVPRKTKKTHRTSWIFGLQRFDKRPEWTHPTTVGHRSKRGWEGCCGSVNQHPLQQTSVIAPTSAQAPGTSGRKGGRFVVATTSSQDYLFYSKDYLVWLYFYFYLMYCNVKRILILTESSIRYVGCPERPSHRSRLDFPHLAIKRFQLSLVWNWENQNLRDEPIVHDF